MSESPSSLPTIMPPSGPVLPIRETFPAILATLGPSARFAWDEFFYAQVRNPHTRKAYQHAVKRFLAWMEEQQRDLRDVDPGLVGSYFDQHPGSTPTKKVDLAALRAFFNVLVNRHVLLINPAATVRGERYQVVEGKTPENTAVQARCSKHNWWNW
jgi:integrase/recombinase XerD